MRTISDERLKRPTRRKGGETAKLVPMQYQKPAETKIEVLAYSIAEEINRRNK